MVEATKLLETKGSFTFKGKIIGLNSDNAVREGVTGTDKEYKSLSFDVQTSPTNRIRVEMFGMEREVIFYSSKAKQTKRVPFENRNKVNLKGYKLMGVNINPTTDKANRKVLIEYDAVDYIKEHFNDGDSVYIRGQLDFSEYENAHGEKVNKTGFRIQSISRMEEIDFDEEDFQPHAFFKQDIVVTDLMKEEDKLYINAKIIKYNGELADAQFVVEANRLKKFAKTLEKKLGFGDLIHVKGWVVSEKHEELEEVEEEDTEDWGGETPEGMSGENYITNYVNELIIVNVDVESHEPKKYTEEDLFSKEEEDYGKDNEEDEDEDFDDDEELPFDED